MKGLQKSYFSTVSNDFTRKERLTIAEGKRVYKHVAILDLKGVGMSHFGEKFRSTLREVLQLDQTFYPESLFVLIVVNAGFLIRTIWSIVSPWLDPITLQRVRIFYF